MKINHISTLKFPTNKFGETMTRTFFTILATALSLLVVDLVVPGVNIATFPAALIAAAAIGAVNSSVKPILTQFSLPLNYLSLGAFSVVVNGICFWLASVLVPGFSASGVLAILLGPIVLSFVNTFVTNYFAERKPELQLAQKTSDPQLAQGSAEVKLPEKKSELKTEA